VRSCLIFFAIVAALGQAQSAPEPLPLADRGLAEAQRGNCEAAIGPLTQAASQAPTRADFFNALGVCESSLGRPERAIADFERVVRLQPQVWQGWNNLGGSYLASRRPHDAVGAFRTAIAKNPNAASPWMNLGSGLSELGRTLDAYRAVDRAQRIEPRDPQIIKAWLRLAAAIATEAGHLIDDGKYTPALARLSAVQRPLEHSASWNNLIGYAEFKLQQPEKAQRHLRQASELDPDNEGYLLDVTGLLTSRHAYAEAIEFLEVGLKRVPNSVSIRFSLAVNQLLDQRREKATSALEALHVENPELEYVSHALGEAYEAAENWSAMVTLGRKLQIQYPNAALGWYLEGAGLEHLTIQGNESPLVALHALQRAAVLDPSSARCHFQLGKEYEAQRDYPHAIRELQRAIRIDPQHERAHYVLAMVYKKAGEVELASEQFRIHKTIKTKGQQEAYSTMLAGTHGIASESGENWTQ
jgi:Flp pilus assembly protein TadD